MGPVDPNRLTSLLSGYKYQYHSSHKDYSRSVSFSDLKPASQFATPPRKALMQPMDGGRSGGRRLKDRLAWLLRPANSFLRSPCSSSSTTFTTAAATTISTSSSSATADALLPRVEPFSAALDLLHHPPREQKEGNKQRCSSSARHARRRHFKDGLHGKGVRKLSSNPYGFTSDDDDDGSDVTGAFLSSRSVASSDFSGFYTCKQLSLPAKNKSRRDNRQPRQHQTRRRRRRAAASFVEEACGVREWDEEVGSLRPLVVADSEEEVRKGLAVVKRSRDPYGDFRESMVEMIVERQVFGAAELERLLRTYLSLNAPRLHPVIIQAFSDIWVVLRGC